MNCSSCGNKRDSNHYYCKACKAEYQRQGRCDNRVDKNTKSKQQSKLTDNYNDLF